MRRRSFVLPLLALLLGLPAAAAAQTQATRLADDADRPVNEIVVTGTRLATPADRAIPEKSYDEAEIRSFGAADVGEVVRNVAARSRNGQGQDPIVLLNGRRISGFGEISGLPPEAVKSVDVLPERVALGYGYGPGRRVINVVLLDRFAASTGELRAGTSTRGGRGNGRIGASTLGISYETRWSLEGSYQREARLLEAQRRSLSGLDGDPRYRTLLPGGERASVNAAVSGFAMPGVSGTLNVRAEKGSSDALLGLAGAAGQPARRHIETASYHAGGIANGALAAWQWSLTANLDRTTTRSELGLPATSSGSAARWSTNSAAAELVAYGTILTLPAGPATGSVTLADQHVRLSASGTGQPSSRRGRDRQSVQASLDVPLFAAPAGGGLGSLSANGSLAVSHLSDFGTLRRISYGIDWRVRPALSLTAGMIDEDRSPTVDQLGSAATEAPNYRLFDIASGQTIDVMLVEGGNRTLTRSNRRQANFGLLLRPLPKADFTLRADYIHIRQARPVYAFPAFTTDLRTAFPERFEVDGTGRIVRIDARPLNFRSSLQESVRWGIAWSHAYAGATPADTLRADLTAFHTWALRDRAQVRAGGPTLDYLGGASASLLGGRSEHLLELQSGLYRNGLGLRLDGLYRSASEVRDPGGSNRLRFGSLATFDLRLFWDEAGASGKRPPWLRNSRVTLAVSNLFDSRPRVRLTGGTTPLAYQPALLDPLGRWVSITLRKLF